MKNLKLLDKIVAKKISLGRKVDLIIIIKIPEFLKFFKVSEIKLTQASKSVTLKPYAKIRVRNLPLGVSPILSSVGISR